MRMNVGLAAAACLVAGVAVFQAQSANSAPRAYYGVYRGTVVANADPEGRRRVKVRIESVSAASARWAEVAFPIGLTADAATLPAVEDQVLVAFEQGDAARPYVLGRL